MKLVTRLLVLWATVAWLTVPANMIAANPPDDCDWNEADDWPPPQNNGGGSSKKNSKAGQLITIGITAGIGIGVLVGVGRMYFVWRSWQASNQRQRAPWERAG